MVRCRDDSFYVGIANDVQDRLKRHNWGVGPSYTAKRRPVELVWSERCRDCHAARWREKQIKGWSREKKLELVEGARREALRVNSSPASPGRKKDWCSRG